MSLSLHFNSSKLDASLKKIYYSGVKFSSSGIIFCRFLSAGAVRLLHIIRKLDRVMTKGVSLAKKNPRESRRLKRLGILARTHAHVHASRRASWIWMAVLSYSMAPSHGNCQLHANTGERLFRKFMPEIQLHARSMRLPRHLSAHCAWSFVYLSLGAKARSRLCEHREVGAKSRPRQQN